MVGWGCALMFLLTVLLTSWQHTMPDQRFISAAPRVNTGKLKYICLLFFQNWQLQSSFLKSSIHVFTILSPNLFRDETLNQNPTHGYCFASHIVKVSSNGSKTNTESPLAPLLWDHKVSRNEADWSQNLLSVSPHYLYDPGSSLYHAITIGSTIFSCFRGHLSTPVTPGCF